MSQHQGNIEVLILKYLQNELSKKEDEDLKNWLFESEENRQIFETLTNENELSAKLRSLYSFDEEKGWNKVKEWSTAVNRTAAKGERHDNWRRIPWVQVAVAAMFLLAVGIAILRSSVTEYGKTAKREIGVLKTGNNDAAPGTDKAILTLADGNTISLGDLNDGALAEQGNTKIFKINGKLLYKQGISPEQPVLYNTISTPRGGQFQVILDDGSKVWLNAASSIRFPTAFTAKERRVEITGEAYFEVIHSKKVPFVVAVNGAEVQVMGTHFNVMAYSEEELLKTTLVEGAVRFKKGHQEVVLKPGQQSQLVAGGRVKVVNDVDLSEVVAWKNGSFYFQHADLQTVMRQISRWYNIEVEYKNKNHPDLLHVDIPRNSKLSEVLKALEIAGGVLFKIEANRIVVF